MQQEQIINFFRFIHQTPYNFTCSFRDCLSKETHYNTSWEQTFLSQLNINTIFYFKKKKKKVSIIKYKVSSFSIKRSKFKTCKVKHTGRFSSNLNVKVNFVCDFFQILIRFLRLGSKNFTDQIRKTVINNQSHSHLHNNMQQSLILNLNHGSRLHNTWKK